MIRPIYLFVLAPIALFFLLSVPDAAPPVGKAPPTARIPPKVDTKEINRAIDSGVAYLKTSQNDDGGWHYDSYGHNDNYGLGYTKPGITALVGLTLLHCDMEAKDPILQKASRFVRLYWREILRSKALIPSMGTYSLSVALLFLDRLGDPADRVLIRQLTLVLMKLQQPANGCWGYGNFQWDTMERRRLKNPFSTYTDSSNTQFALLGLWAGHRHGVRVAVPLARAAAGFLRMQNSDGGWPYAPDLREPGASLSGVSTTCYGLLALALRHAAANEDVLRQRKSDESSTTAPKRAMAQVAQDPHVIQGFRYIHQFVKTQFHTPGVENEEVMMYCRLWSIERTALAFDLRTLDGADWYNIGANYLVRQQGKDGRWERSGHYELADTCFALLFLRRANLLPDVTSLLKGEATDSGPDLSAADSRKPPVEPSSVPKKEPGSDLTSSLTSLGSRRPSLESKLAPKPVAPAPPTALEKQHHQSRIDRLLTLFKASSGVGREMLLKHWRDGEDEYFTPALAKVIPTLSGSLERQARSALADRLTRLNSTERDEHLRSDDAEIRRAAILSCAVRDDKNHIARLIELLQDKEPLAAHAAHEVLCSLTGKDFGPSADASGTDHAHAVTEWKNWWSNQANK